jgi:hypothetical protein
VARATIADGPTHGAPKMTGGLSSPQLSFSSSWLHSSSTAAPIFRSGGLGHDATPVASWHVPAVGPARRSRRFITVACQCSSQRDRSRKDSGIVGKRFCGLEASDPDWCQITWNCSGARKLFVLVPGYPGRPRSLEGKSSKYKWWGEWPSGESPAQPHAGALSVLKPA